MSKKRISRPLVFSATDCFGNYVELPESTWIEHVLDEHPEMAGYEELVKTILRDPYQVRRSTKHSTGAAFISAAGVGPRPEGIRALVIYSVEIIEVLKGSTTGFVTTAYPIDSGKYSNPRIGTPIYTKGGQTK